MGYTHYITQRPATLEQKTFEQFSKEAKKILKTIVKDGIPIADGGGEVKNEFICDKNLISFNGLDEGSHETCYVERVADCEFSFCKTNRKGYDAAVTAVFALFKDWFPAITVRSDGNAKEWAEGLKYASDTLGRNIDLPF